MDGFVELVWENDEIVRRRPSTFILSRRGSAAARGDDSPSHTHGHMLYNFKKRANINSVHNSSTVNNHHETSNTTPTRNVFELFSSPTPTQQKQLASAARDEERNRPLLLNLIKTSGPPPHHHQQQPKRVKRPPLADAHAMHLVPDAHDDQDDRQTPILDQDHQNYHYHNHNHNHNHNQEEALVPSLNSGGDSNDHHLPNTLQSVEQEQVPQTLTGQVSAPRATPAKRDAPTTKLHKLSERRRREKINKKMRALQALIPNCNKADKASILDDAIAYLKTLQLQLQMMMSMGTGLNQMHSMMLPNNGALVPHLSYFSPIPPITSRLGVQMFGFPVSAPQPSFMPWHVPPSLQVPRF